MWKAIYSGIPVFFAGQSPQIKLSHVDIMPSLDKYSENPDPLKARNM